MGAGAGEHRKTLWWSTANRRPQTSAIEADLSVETAVIGGGFTGLTAALHLARRGVRVALLEADEIGAGASGVNAGFVVPNFAKADPASVVARLGKERGQRLGLACAAEQTGWPQPAHSSAAADMLRARAAAWSALGRPVSFLSADEVRAQTGMDRYHGALLDASGGTIHPLNYAYGLARSAGDAGALIFENARVDAIERDGARWRLRVAGRSVSAATVVLCSNASMTGAARKLGRNTVPLRVYQIATEPLPKDVVNRIAPDRRPVGDTRANLFTYRLDRDDRLITGGMAIIPIHAHERMARMMAKRLSDELRLPLLRVDFAWRGVAAMTPDFLPHLYEFGPGFIGGVGCNGRGVAMTAMLGEVLANAATGTALADLPVPVASGRGIPFHILAAAAPSFAVAQARWSDRRAEGA